MTIDLKRRREIFDLGIRAIEYYRDTGLCVFCDADDCTDTPHEDCNVGELSGVVLDKNRKLDKAFQRGLVDFLLRSDLISDA